MPFVTIIIPYKNNLKYLFLALKSVFRQSYKKFKILIIYDDENKSDLIEINNFLSKNNYQKNFFINIIENAKNLGAGESRNIGIKKSDTTYIAFLDSDDIWDVNKLKIQLEFMEKNKLLISHTSYHIINSEDKIISFRNAKSNIILDDLIKSCDIGLSTVILNLKFLNENNLYFPNLKTKEDYVLWLKIILHIKEIKGIDMKLSYYRKTKNSLSSNKILGLINGYKVYRKYMNYSIIKSIYHLIILSLSFIKKKVIYDFNNNNKL